jgi:hypothetical protein
MQNKMAKPIFLIGFPLEADNTAVYQVQQDLSQKLDGEYHVIAYKIQGVTAIDFKVLNAIDATDVQIEELIAKTSEFANQLLSESNKLVQEVIDAAKNNQQ